MAEVNTYVIGKSYNVISNCAVNTGISVAGPAIIKSIEIPPFNFSSGDVVTIEACLAKQGSNGGYYHAVYWNTSSSLTNARKVFESSVNPTDNGTYIGSTLTYSSIYCRLQIVSGTTSTKSYDPNYVYTTTVDGRSSDLFLKDTTTPASTWEQIGTQEGLTSINWEQWSTLSSSGGYFIVAGGVQSTLDVLRCEWIKISGLTTGLFIDPTRAPG
jgi:hypothetical protein